MLTDDEIRELFKQHAPVLDFGEDVLAFARAIEGGAYLYSDRWYSRGEIAELARDAERYRWLRKRGAADDDGLWWSDLALDDNIDAAIAAESPPSSRRYQR